MKQNNISSVVLMITFLFYQWDPQNLQGRRDINIFGYKKKSAFYLISNHMFVHINNKDVPDAPCSHSNFDDIHAHSVCVQKA